MVRLFSNGVIMTFKLNIAHTGTTGWIEQTLPISYTSVNSYAVFQGIPSSSDTAGSNTNMTDTTVHKTSKSEYKIYLQTSTNALAYRMVFTIGY